jgi:prepilin-type processing-associated H-X9-DG protein
VGNNGVFFLNSAVHYEDITDGSSHTIFVGEKIVDQGDTLGWMSGTRATLRNAGSPINAARTRTNRGMPPEAPTEEGPLYVGGFGSHHPGGANFAFGDGHVRFISETLDQEVLQQLAARADGKLLMRDDF